uniref:Uncharacterized protein LOC105060912 isoform X2 n=1 Tax=Elaeis guineensis var. tenera TaxID=51953 RepID=A0A8N4IA87_ELAGV|nr:uncharacterized protein LOC105060912 isoform X2 [Elaeis guineensis]
MGYCASVQKNPDSAMGFRLGLGSQAKRFFIPSPAKEKPLNGQISVGGFDFKGKVVDSGAGLRSPEFDLDITRYCFDGPCINFFIFKEYLQHQTFVSLQASEHCKIPVNHKILVIGSSERLPKFLWTSNRH